MMDSSENPTVEKDYSDSLAGEVQHDIRQRVFYQGRCRIPRRYVISIILCLVLVVQFRILLTISFTILHTVIFSEGPIQNHTIGHWTHFELEIMNYINLLAEICSPIPGALLVYRLSSHKFLFLSVAVSSILHMLTPLALQHHSYIFVGLLVSQWVIMAPLEVAVVSVWKDWSPPGERTRLLALTFFGLFLCTPSTPSLSSLWDYSGNLESFYISGCCGLVLSLVWYFLTSDSPSSDRFITEKEYLYLQNTIPSVVKETTKISEIPWKSILISKPVLALCLVHYKTAFSLMITIFNMYRMLIGSPFYEIFLTSYVVIIPFTTMLADFLIRKLNGRTTLIRKIFLCGAYVIYAFLLLGMIWRSEFTRAIFFLFSNMVLAVSIPGYITIALDLSPRYVAIIAALSYVFQRLGISTFYIISINTYNYWKDDPYGWCFIFDCILSVIAAGIFWHWGSAEEQLWSMGAESGPRCTGYLSFPKPDDEDDTSLLSSNL